MALFIGMMFLDNQHGLIAFEVLFHGTINQSAVYPREVIRTALKHNAADVTLSHNHPSGNTTPSADDRKMTDVLKQAFTLIDVRVLDHIVIGGGRTTSFADRGLL
ncbi:hypothetical protein EO087_04540 [Dyella sp. M7H15-1]|nr:JAB domain-containing protein [Dyella sp. M7H15-1]QAU23339.1 hypothetical protein EO087_04540 [Dyella sp. M7H15-1]